MTTPVEHITAATGAIRSATDAVGRTLPEITTAEEWSSCLSLMEAAAKAVYEMEGMMRRTYSATQHWQR